LSDAFLIADCLKQGDALLPLLLIFALESTIRKSQGKEERLELDTWDSGYNLNLLDYHKEEQVHLEVNAEKTKYMFVSHQQNVGQDHNLKIANKSKMCKSSNVWEQR